MTYLLLTAETTVTTQVNKTRSRFPCAHPHSTSGCFGGFSPNAAHAGVFQEAQDKPSTQRTLSHGRQDGAAGDAGAAAMPHKAGFLRRMHAGQDRVYSRKCHSWAVLRFHATIILNRTKSVLAFYCGFIWKAALQVVRGCPGSRTLPSAARAVAHASTRCSCVSPACVTAAQATASLA